MAAASLQLAAGGVAGLSGTLDFSSVPLLWPELARLIDESGTLELSLKDVDSANSAALALLLEGAEHAGRMGHTIRFSDMPQGLVDLANLSNVAELLGS